MNIEGWALLSLLATYLCVSVLLIVVPIIGAKQVLFGVHIPDDAAHDPQAAAVKRHYVGYSILASVIGLAAALLAAWLWEGSLEVAAPAALFLQIMGTLLAMQHARRSAVHLKASRGWQRPADTRRVVSLSFRSSKLAVGNGWYTVHVVLAAVSIFFAVLLWDRIPATLTTHYDGRFNPDGYSSKGFASVFMLNIIQLLMTGIFLFTNVIIRLAKQQLNPNEAEKSLEKQRRFRYASSLFLYSLSLLILLLFSYIQATTLYGWPLAPLKIITFSLPVVIIASLIIHILYLSRKGISQNDSSSESDDQHWKASGIYYNQEDPSLFVSKRSGRLDGLYGTSTGLGHLVWNDCHPDRYYCLAAML